jgi:amino acid transporter
MNNSIYTIGPLDQALQSPTGYPFIDMFFNATNSYAATDIMTTIVIINFTASAVASLATASRQLWAFARSRGVPFSTSLAPVSSKILKFHALQILGVANDFRALFHMIFLSMHSSFRWL